MRFTQNLFSYDSHLTNHDGESKDSHEVVDELEDDFKDSGGIRQTSDGDQSLHSKVVAANITVCHKHRLILHHLHCAQYTVPLRDRLRVISSPVSFAIIDPFGRTQSFIVRTQIENTGIDVQRVQQVRTRPDHPAMSYNFEWTVPLRGIRFVLYCSLVVASGLTCKCRLCSSQLPDDH